MENLEKESQPVKQTWSKISQSTNEKEKESDINRPSDWTQTTNECVSAQVRVKVLMTSDRTWPCVECSCNWPSQYCAYYTLYCLVFVNSVMSADCRALFSLFKVQLTSLTLLSTMHSGTDHMDTSPTTLWGTAKGNDETAWTKFQPHSLSVAPGFQPLTPSNPHTHTQEPSLSLQQQTARVQRNRATLQL